MKNSDSHVYLYAKNWYKRTNTVEDLCRIYEHRNGLSRGSLNIFHIFPQVARLVFKHIENDYQFQDFMEKCFIQLKVFPEKTTTMENVLNVMLSILSNVTVEEDGKTILELDDLDYTILPEKEKEK